jgi:hypothetical protein
MQAVGSEFQAKSRNLKPAILNQESGIRNLESGTNGLPALAHLAQAELDQVFGFESAARPAISLLKLDSKQVVGFFEFAVFDAGLAVFALELKG